MTTVRTEKKRVDRSMSWHEDVFFVDKKPMPQCAICMELIGDNDRTVLKCGHEFHAECMFSCVITQNNRCPLCRTEVSKKPESRPEMNRSLMRIFIQNEFNQINMSGCLSDIFAHIMNHIKNKKVDCWQDISIEDRGYMSGELIQLMNAFGMRLGYQIDDWIKQGDDRMYIPDEFENEPLRVPLDAYYDIGVEEEKDDEDYDDMPSLISVSDDEEPVIENEIAEEELEPINLMPIFTQEENPLSPAQSITQDIIVYLQGHFPDQELGRATDLVNRIINCPWLHENLEDVDEEQIMFPPEGHDPVDGPLFTREEARIIFGAVLRYHTETLYP